MRPTRRSLTFLVAALFTSTITLSAAPDQDRDAVVKLVSQIQKADYEADRGALHRLSGELTPLANNKDLASRVYYWRGFALWRSALNGFNGSADKNEVHQDLILAVEAFDRSVTADPAFVDSRIGIASCLGLLAYSLESDSPERQEHIARMRLVTTEARAAAPDNPRLLWILGPVYWNIPVASGGGQDKAIATYTKGLETIRGQRPASDSLEPSWGEPELLMALAWSYLNQATPDLNAAELNATSALQIVPNWHYVRDILMAQIREAKAKQAGKS